MLTDLISPSLTVDLITAGVTGDPPSTVILTKYAAAVAPVPSPLMVTVGVSLYLDPFALM